MTVSPGMPSKKPGPLINRNFALLWSGQAISNLGDFLFGPTLVLWIAVLIARGQPWAPLAVSGVLLADSIPMFIVRPFAGVFVDRWDKRRTMLQMDALRAVLIALLLLATNSVPLPFIPDSKLSLFWQLSIIYMLVLLASICAQFFNPSLFALIGDIVPEPDRPRASGLNLVTSKLATLIGPSLAGPLLFAWGVQWALVINALSFAVSFLAVLAIRPPKAATNAAPGHQGNLIREFGEGMRFCARNHVLMTIMISLVIVMFGLGALNTLDIFFVTQNLHAPAYLYGYLIAAFGLGSIAGAALASTFVRRIGLTRLFWLSTLSVGVVMVVFARQANFIAGLLFSFLFGVPDAASNVASEPILLLVTPRELVGRVNSVLTPTWSLAFLLSVALTGYLDSTVMRSFHATLLGITLGPIDTIFTGTGLLVITGGLYAMVNLRGVTLTSASAPTAGEQDE